RDRGLPLPRSPRRKHCLQSAVLHFPRIRFACSEAGAPQGRHDLADAATERCALVREHTSRPRLPPDAAPLDAAWPCDCRRGETRWRQPRVCLVGLGTRPHRAARIALALSRTARGRIMRILGIDPGAVSGGCAIVEISDGVAHTGRANGVYRRLKIAKQAERI